jgi:hypothetical protein
MSRNIYCNCLCHGTDGNRIGDEYFSCKNCYPANHMGNLPRQSHEAPRPKKGPRKQARASKPAAVALDAVVKEVTKAVMENIAMVAEMSKHGEK